jgi:hypothetical protein
MLCSYIKIMFWIVVIKNINYTTKWVFKRKKMRSACWALDIIQLLRGYKRKRRIAKSVQRSGYNIFRKESLVLLKS